MHMFRATHADNLLSVKGYHIRAIASRLGHASIATTDRYLSNQHRISKTYPSLAARYRWYEKVWEPKTQGGADGGKSLE
jgi:integrase